MEEYFEVRRDQGVRARVIPLLHECICNESTVSIVLPGFSIPAPWVLLRVRRSITQVPPWKLPLVSLRGL